MSYFVFFFRRLSRYLLCATFFSLILADLAIAEMQRMGVVQQSVIVGGGHGESQELQAYCLDESRDLPFGAMSILPGSGLGKVTRLPDERSFDLGAAIEAGWVAIDGIGSVSSLQLRSLDGKIYRLDIDNTFAMTSKEQLDTERTDGLQPTLAWLESKGPKPALSPDDVWDHRTFTEHGLDPELASAFGYRHKVVSLKNTLAEQAAQREGVTLALAHRSEGPDWQRLVMTSDGTITVFDGPNADREALRFAGRQDDGNVSLVVPNLFGLEQATQIKSTLERFRNDLYAKAAELEAATQSQISAPGIDGAKRDEILTEYYEKSEGISDQMNALDRTARERLSGTVESGLTLAAQAADIGVDSVRLLDVALEPLAGAGGGGARLIVGPNAAAGDFNGGDGFELSPTDGTPFPVRNGFPIKNSTKIESRVDVQANDGWWVAFMRSTSVRRLRSLTDAVYGTLRSSVNLGLSTEATTQAVAKAAAFDRAIFEDIQDAARTLPESMQAELLLMFNNDQQLNIRITGFGIWLTHFALLDGSWVRQGTPVFRRF